MPTLLEAIIADGNETTDRQFPHAPEDWTPASAAALAHREGLALTDEHWEALRALQSYFARHDGMHINPRELHDALDERFHVSGGLRHLYQLFPGGPVAQGCRLAGLTAPTGATDRNYGSVM